ncbi:uncharacterized protein LOC34622719, partial [Cyclospora cayetanensis]|uniref:Uncharacterized protein LOC34622719 n=1 Tax=Cyclospora cayetanensis TaxID=88456 RepID=A0A6P6S1Q7_9EIME
MQPEDKASHPAFCISRRFAASSLLLKRERQREDGPRDTPKMNCLLFGFAASGGQTPADVLKRVRSEGCVLKKQTLVRNSPLPLTSCYRLEEVIGYGSFGCTVFRATDIFSGIRRVVKCVRKEQPEGICLCRNEVKFLRTFDHPNILRLFEVFEESGAVYQVTETCHGGDLYQWLDRRIRRRKRHARKASHAFFMPLKNNYVQEESHRWQGGLNESVSLSASFAAAESVPQAVLSSRVSPQQSEKTEGSSTPFAAAPSVGFAGGTPSGVATNSGISPTSAASSNRSGGSMRSACPAAVGAAAAAATAAAAGLQCPSNGVAGEAAAAAVATPLQPLVSEELAARLAAQLLGALRYLHAKGVAHCDLKLENVLLLNELDDSEAGDGQSSEEEEEALLRAEQQQQRQLLVLQQQQEDAAAAALCRARRGMRALSSAHSSSSSSSLQRGAASSNSTGALTIVPMVLRKRRESRKRLDSGGGGLIELSSQENSSQTLLDGLSRRSVTVKLADFGLARKIVRGKPSKTTGSEVCRGTLYYRSPWIIRGMTEGDARSDLWALGVGLFILFTGRPPFDGATQEDVEKAVTECPVSFSGGAWPVLSLQCVGFLRALLYNPLLPLHLRGPPPPPPYEHPTADLMLKHPWIRQCGREERRKGLMRVLSAPSIQRLSRSTGGEDCSPLQGRSAAKATANAKKVGRTLSHSPELQHGTDEESASPKKADFRACCSTCSTWKCAYGCCCYSHPMRKDVAFQPLRLCWGRAPLVVGSTSRETPSLLAHRMNQGVRDGLSPLPQQSLLGSSPLNEAIRKTPQECLADTSNAVLDGRRHEQQGALNDHALYRGVSASNLEPLKPHLRLSGPSARMHGLEGCAAATNAAAAAAAAAAGVAKAVRRETEATVSGHLGLPLENVPHFHLQLPLESAFSPPTPSVRGEASAPPLRELVEEAMDICTDAGEASTVVTTGSRSHSSTCSTCNSSTCCACNKCVGTRCSSKGCCIAVVDLLTAELFESRVSFLLQACAWIDFARLSPLQRALRSVVVKLMEEGSAVRLVRDIFWVLDPQQTGSVSRKAGGRRGEGTRGCGDRDSREGKWWGCWRLLALACGLSFLGALCLRGSRLTDSHGVCFYLSWWALCGLFAQSG